MAQLSSILVLPNPLPAPESLWLTDEKEEGKAGEGREGGTGREEVESARRTCRSSKRPSGDRSDCDNFQTGTALMTAS